MSQNIITAYLTFFFRHSRLFFSSNSFFEKKNASSLQLKIELTQKKTISKKLFLFSPIYLKLSYSWLLFEWWKLNVSIYLSFPFCLCFIFLISWLVYQKIESHYPPSNPFTESREAAYLKESIKRPIVLRVKHEFKMTRKIDTITSLKQIYSL